MDFLHPAATARPAWRPSPARQAWPRAPCTPPSGTKREILSLICQRWLEQADARELVGQVLAEPDPLARLRGAAHWLRVLYAAGFDVVLIFEAATDDSPETRALLRSKLAGTSSGC